jgi:UDP-hydrolysing UDP-N-acetyl-D-glucosamine 2-epimerase
MKKIIYISGTRADYGLMREVLLAIREHPQLEIEIAATGMHLMPEFGNTIKEIEKDGFKIHRVEAVFEKDSQEAVIEFISSFLFKFLKKIKENKPDIIFVQGDRPEMLAGAIAGAYLSIPVVHSHGGDVSSTVDEITRHSITKLSHLHFPATEQSAQRIIKMGEDKSRVYVVGAPGLDAVLSQKLLSKEEITKKYGCPALLIIQHPVTAEIKHASKQMEETMEAVKEIKEEAVVIYPNADPGSREMIKVIEEYRKEPFIRIYKSIPRQDYLSLMKIAKAVLGNSSSGLIEAPSFNLKVINIGTRQSKRERAANVIDVGYDRNQIKGAFKAVSKIENSENPYGDGKTSQRIVKILADLEINKELLNKRLSY